MLDILQCEIVEVEGRRYSYFFFLCCLVQEALTRLEVVLSQFTQLHLLFVAFV